jgi:hypothetical protein
MNYLNRISPDLSLSIGDTVAISNSRHIVMAHPEARRLKGKGFITSCAYDYDLGVVYFKTNFTSFLHKGLGCNKLKRSKVVLVEKYI